MGAIPLLPTVPLTVTVTATMGAIPLLPTALPTVTVAATMVVATITTPIAVQAVPPCGQRRPLQLILQAPRHTALLPMARAPQAGATVVTITTVCSVSPLCECFALPLLTSLGVRMHEPVWISLFHEYAPCIASKWLREWKWCNPHCHRCSHSGCSPLCAVRPQCIRW